MATVCQQQHTNTFFNLLTTRAMLAVEVILHFEAGFRHTFHQRHLAAPTPPLTYTKLELTQTLVAMEASSQQAVLHKNLRFHWDRNQTTHHPQTSTATLRTDPNINQVRFFLPYRSKPSFVPPQHVNPNLNQVIPKTS